MSTNAIAPAVENEHTTYWDAMARPPASALKQIRGGRLTGMTDVNPQWRYRAMTETFGPCGDGWKYEITRTWTEPGTEGQVLAFAEVALYWRDEGGKWNGPIPGIGGSMLIAKESSGLRVNDEGFKMAVTDALSVALKMLGVAADIYAGLWDGSKYKEEAVQPEIKMPTRLSERRPQQATPPAPAPAVDPEVVDALMDSIAATEGGPFITETDRRHLMALCREHGHDPAVVKRYLARRGISSSKLIPVSAFGAIRDRLADPAPLEV